MRYALMTEPQQGLSYDEILAVARTAEEAGLEAFFRSDHYASFPGGAGKPTTDAWTTLAGLARETSTIRLGVLVSPVTFRLPGNLAKVIQTVDEMSDGRVEAGFGAGWNDDEHAQLGLPFPALGERFDLLEEQMAIIHGLWTEPDGWSFDGEHWQVRESKRHGEIAPRRSAPSAHHLRRQGRRAPGAAGCPVRRRVQPQLGIARRLLPEAYASVRVRLHRDRPGSRRDRALRDDRRAGCRDRGRPSGARGRPARRARPVGSTMARRGLPSGAGRWIMGTPEQAFERVRALEANGTQRIMLQDFVPRDLDHVRLMGKIFTA